MIAQTGCRVNAVPVDCNGRARTPARRMVSGVGGRSPSELRGRRWLYSRRHCSIRIRAYLSVKKSSSFKSWSLSLLLSDSMKAQLAIVMGPLADEVIG